ncbi:MAG: hypothetical protein JWP18_1564, partial [Solirubrobacterales bacterium]|nr:hypothetical protein [Solirubrobacterales bacterium]
MVPPVQHPQEPDDPQAGSVVDPRVVAERRAHRAELSEAALRERVVDAEHRLVEAQRLLGGAYDQRKDLAGRLKQAERDLRAARQGEHAEAQRRVELEEDAGVARRQAEQEITALRAALVASEQRVSELEQELDRVQRTAAELQQAVATAQVQGGPTATAPDGARDAAAAQLAARLEEVRVVEERLAAGRDELARRRGGLETRLHDTGVVAGSLEERIVAEREARLRAVHELENERERASAEVTLLQHELDRRMQVQEAVSQQLVELRAELAQTQARVASDAERRALAESVLTELGTTALQLRDELQSLEDERRDVERQLAAARAQVAERDTRLEEQAAYLTAADAALTALRVELDEAATALRTTSGDTTHQQERLDAAERAVTQAEAQSLHLAQQLESERRERARMEQELRTRIAEERDAFQNTVEQHRLATERAIALERAAFEAHVTTVRDGVVALRERLAGVEADVEARLQQERDARLAAEQRLEAERHGRAVALTELQAERTTAAKSGADRERREAETQALRGRLAEVEQELTAARTLVAVERGRVDDATAAA